MSDKTTAWCPNCGKPMVANQHGCRCSLGDILFAGQDATAQGLREAAASVERAPAVSLAPVDSFCTKTWDDNVPLGWYPPEPRTPRELALERILLALAVRRWDLLHQVREEYQATVDEIVVMLRAGDGL